MVAAKPKLLNGFNPLRASLYPFLFLSFGALGPSPFGGAASRRALQGPLV